jgi:hypothetical protein
MCLSPEVDAAAGLLIGAVAVDGLRHVRRRSELALASLPMVLAVHQLIEVLVWWGVEGTVASSVGRAATYAYLLIAFGLPLLVPPAVAAIEPDRRRLAVMEGLGVVGAFVALALLASVATGPVSAVDGGYHIAYGARLFHGGALAAVYVLVTLGCLLVSSHRYVVAFGAINLAAVGVLAWLTVAGFVSLWCAWAAVTSVLIAHHLRTATRTDSENHGLPDGAVLHVWSPIPARTRPAAGVPIRGNAVR